MFRDQPVPLTGRRSWMTFKFALWYYTYKLLVFDNIIYPSVPFPMFLLWLTFQNQHNTNMPSLLTWTWQNIVLTGSLPSKHTLPTDNDTHTLVVVQQEAFPVSVCFHPWLTGESLTNSWRRGQLWPSRWIFILFTMWKYHNEVFMFLFMCIGDPILEAHSLCVVSWLCGDQNAGPHNVNNQIYGDASG